MVEDKNKNNLKDLKKKYSELEKKFGLPSFKEMNEDFQIERLAELETESLVREIRKFVAEKILNFTRFVETLLNPANAGMFYFAILKTLKSGDKKLLEEIYKKLVKIEVDLIELDMQYSETKEAEFVKMVFKEWQTMKIETVKVVETIKKNWDNKSDLGSIGNGGYFG